MRNAPDHAIDVPAFASVQSNTTASLHQDQETKGDAEECLGMRKKPAGSVTLFEVFDESRI